MPRHAEDLQDFLSARPNGFIRQGSTVIGLVAAMLLTLSWFVSYHDTVPIRVTLTTASPPVPVLAPATGLLDRLWVREGECVEPGRMLGAVDGPGDPDALAELGAFIAARDSIADRPGELAALLPAEAGDIGPLRAELSGLEQAIGVWRLHADPDSEAREAELRTQRRAHIEALVERTRGQLWLVGADVERARARHAQSTSLTEKGVLSTVQLDEVAGDLLRRRLEYGSAMSSELTLRLQLAELEASFFEAERQHDATRLATTAAVRTAFRDLQRGYLSWQRAYTMQAPVAGCVSMHRVWTEHQVVLHEQPVMSLVAPRGEVIAVGRIPQASVGRVAPGQQVQMNVDSYPMYEYGQLGGTVRAVAEVGDADGYGVTIVLYQGLTTDRDRALGFRSGMMASARIVIRERRVIERILSQFWQLVLGDGPA